MLLRLLTDQVGLGFVRYEGETYDLPREEALALLRAGQAEKITGQPERATRSRTTTPKRRKKKS